MTERRLALITGSTRGLGLAIALELGRHGFTPILNYHSDDEAAERAIAHLQAVRDDVHVVRADVGSSDGVDRLFDAVERIGSLDVLVNNVGRFIHRPFLETPSTEWQAVLDSNLLSAVNCCRRVLPGMRERGHGHIINIGVMHAGEVRARPNTLPYAIAKAGILHLTRTLAKTEGPFGVRVNAICPGFIDGGEHTAPSSADRTALGRLGRPEDVAQAAGYLVSPEADYITGAALEVHGGALL